MYSLRVLPGAALVFWSASLMFAQEKPSAPSLLSKVVSLSGGNAEEKSSACKPLELLTAKELTFHQRTCFYGQKLLSKGMLGRATLFNGFAQFRNSPDMKDDGLNEFARRFSIYYARRTAQSRPRRPKPGVWRQAKAGAAACPAPSVVNIRGAVASSWLRWCTGPKVSRVSQCLKPREAWSC